MNHPNRTGGAAAGSPVTLVVMAAGMGSRYHGLKQIDPVGKSGEIIMDFSLYDAWKAGFRKVVFIISKDVEADFRETIGDKVSRFMEVHYAFQSMEDLPEGYDVPGGRTKPWGTAHAVFSCRHVVDGPFAVINADDYYGRKAFRLIHDYLVSMKEGETKGETYRYAMVGYTLENTMTENGSVARGVCTIDENANLQDIQERTRIEKRNGLSRYTEDGERWITIPEGSIVSMNLWGFGPSFLKELERNFPAFLNKILREDPLKGEFFLPSAVDVLLKTGKASVKVLHTPDRWYGVTYREDKPALVKALTHMQETGVYPEELWEDIGDEGIN
ncbi:sugar phosphate nucleotidyltransferase [Eubacteriales bacterium mix99]